MVPAESLRVRVVTGWKVEETMKETQRKQEPCQQRAEVLLLTCGLSIEIAG